MSAPIDEQTAWDLLQALPAGLTGTAPVGRVHHNPRRDVWLQVDEIGRWEASAQLTDAAHRTLELFLPLQLQEEFVIGQSGQSLDGRIATEGGHSHYVTGREDILRLHRLRALVDAVIVGAGTVAADNPRLTVREVEGNNPVRVVLDPDGRLDRRSHVFCDGAARTIAVRRPDAQVGLDDPPADLDEVRLASGADGFEPGAILDTIRAQGLRRVLVEGGGITVSRFLQSGSLDRLHVTVAPMLIGSGRPAFVLHPIASLNDALRPACRHFRLGDDMLFDLDLRASTGH